MIEITKAKIQEGNVVSGLYVQSLVVKDEEGHERLVDAFENQFSGKFASSDELAEAFDRLTPHFALLTDQILVDQVKSKAELDALTAKMDSHKVLKHMKCNQFIISGDTITLSGYRQTTLGKKVNFIGQLNDFKEADNRYEFAYDLSEAVDELISEIEKYVAGNGKGVQLDIFKSTATEKVELADVEEEQEVA